MYNVIPLKWRLLLFNYVIIHIPADAVRSPCFPPVRVNSVGLLKSIYLRLTLDNCLTRILANDNPYPGAQRSRGATTKRGPKAHLKCVIGYLQMLNYPFKPNYPTHDCVSYIVSNYSIIILYYILSSSFPVLKGHDDMV